MISTAVKELNSAKQTRLGQIKDLEAQIQKIDSALAALSGSAVSSAAPAAKAKGKGKMSAAGRRAISLAVKARWATINAAKAKAPAAVSAPVAKPAKKKFVMSPAHKAALKRAQAARWAKVKAAKKK